MGVFLRGDRSDSGVVTGDAQSGGIGSMGEKGGWPARSEIAVCMAWQGMVLAMVLYGMVWPGSFQECSCIDMWTGLCTGGCWAASRVSLVHVLLKAKSVSGILLQSGDWGRAGLDFIFSGWISRERGCGMNGKGRLASVGFDKYRGACPFASFNFFHLGLLKPGFCENTLSSTLVNFHTTLNNLHHCQVLPLVSTLQTAHTY